MGAVSVRVLGGLLVAFTMLCGGCATTGSRSAAGSRPATAAATKPDDDPDKLVCWMEKPVGSNIAEKVCKTRRQLADERRQAQDVLRRPPRGKDH